MKSTEKSTVGLWLVGAHGSVATTLAVGLGALQRSLTQDVGLVSQLPQFRDLGLVDWSQLILGGHDIRETTSHAEAMQLANSERPVLPAELVERCQDLLGAFDQRIRPGVLYRCGSTIDQLATPRRSVLAETPRAAVQQIQQDLKSFAESLDCSTVIVVNLASTEPWPAIDESISNNWDQLEASLDRDDCPLPASSLYAIAALDLGYGYVNFTPSLGSDLPAIDELARQRKTVHAGRDGKTGETFLKSVLAPAMAGRNLKVMSWVGHNILGNRDGLVLDDPLNNQTKTNSKDQLLAQILGYDPQTLVSIEYIRSLGDWKTAWDHIDFRGFLGTPMTLQFTWQASDSILAAPLVLDLCRFVELAGRRGETGTLSQLASFFKSPQGTDQHEFAAQFDQLVRWANRVTV